VDIDKRLIEGDIELREEGGKRTVTGYAAVFNSFSKDLGGWREVIKKGAFTEALASGGEVRAFFNHEPNMLLGSTVAGTVRLTENQRGLKYEIDLPDTSYARDLAELINRKDVRGSSFAFQATDEDWRENGRLREVRSVILHDVSIVTNPAYEAAQVVSMRSMESHKAEVEKAKAQHDHLELEIYLMKQKGFTPKFLT